MCLCLYQFDYRCQINEKTLHFPFISCIIILYSLEWQLLNKGYRMKTLVIGNIEFNIEMIVGSPVGQLIIMRSAKCLETGALYDKEQANRYYRLYSA